MPHHTTNFPTTAAMLRMLAERLGGFTTECGSATPTVAATVQVAEGDGGLCLVLGIDGTEYAIALTDGRIGLQDVTVIAQTL